MSKWYEDSSAYTPSFMTKAEGEEMIKKRKADIYSYDSFQGNAWCNVCFLDHDDIFLVAMFNLDGYRCEVFTCDRAYYEDCEDDEEIWELLPSDSYGFY